MTKLKRNNLIAVLLVVLIWGLMLVGALGSSGCAGQGVRLDVETSDTPCGTKRVRFSTDYQVEELNIGRTIEGGGQAAGGGGEGCGGGYTVTLGKGTTKDSDPAMLLLLDRLLQMLGTAAGIDTPTDTAGSDN